MPVRSIITNPTNGTRLAAGTREMRLRGAAWAGDLEVRRVDVSTDFGATWRQAALSAPKNRFDWRRWTATIRLPGDGYYEVWARATDSPGRRNPMSPATGIPKATAATPCTASPCWWAERDAGKAASLLLGGSPPPGGEGLGVGEIPHHRSAFNPPSLSLPHKGEGTAVVRAHLWRPSPLPAD